MALFVFSNCTAQIPNAKSTTVHVYGNCGMCEKTIEKAAYQKGQAKAEWDQETQMAQITFDSTLTNVEEVLQRIAAAGYDSDKFTANDEAYSNLAECCQYDRPKKADAPAGENPVGVSNQPTTDTPTAAAAKTMGGMVKKQAVAPTVANPLSAVYAAYFALKDALVATDGSAAAAQAKTLLTAIEQVNMEALTAGQQAVWTSYQQPLRTDAEYIKGVTNTERQREHFATLSKNMYAVMKVIKADAPVYYEHCPMYDNNKGGNWLSQEKTIRNPYFGKKMLACGSVTETLK